MRPGMKGMLTNISGGQNNLEIILRRLAVSPRARPESLHRQNTENLRGRQSEGSLNCMPKKRGLSEKVPDRP